MSTNVSPAPPPLGEELSSVAGNTQSKKSYRRKYRKIMVKFEEKMREGTGLFKDEQRIFDISQRLVEQTDQLLQILQELNAKPQIPRRLRYNLEAPVSERDSNVNIADTLQAMRTSRHEIQKGDLTPYAYQEAQKPLLHNHTFAPRQSYTSLARHSRILLSPPDTSLGGHGNNVGTLSIRQEDEYVRNLDNFLDGKASHPRPHAALSLGSRTVERTTEREREMQLKNPLSAYNWLRKHQPQVFLQDHEGAGEKPVKSTGSRTSKRTGIGKDIKQEQDWYDEDGIAKDDATRSRGKRKRDDDTAFRPKGGKSGHTAKRRKDDGGKKSKRSSLDARGLS